MTSDIDAISFIHGLVLGLLTCIRTCTCTMITRYCYLQYEFDALFSNIIDYSVSEFKTTVFRKRSPLFWPWAGGIVLVLVGTRYKLVALPGHRTSTPRCPSSCQPTINEKSIAHVRPVQYNAVRCVQRRRQPYAQKISSQLPVSQMHGRKSAARLTEMTEMTHNRPSSDSFGRRFMPCCGTAATGRDMTHDATRPRGPSSINYLCCTTCDAVDAPFQRRRITAIARQQGHHQVVTKTNWYAASSPLASKSSRQARDIKVALKDLQ
jgi:hypothetical protein